MTGSKIAKIRVVQQDHLDPKEDLHAYSGQWVALRRGKVVAAALDAVSLQQRPEVLNTDTLMPVPPPGDGIFVA